ncbi:hypothetical protein [Austwickia sp. TVS 96-490-7B]|uniref:hypothetical protein n=1 Tax=Austwickia sp. TVS 96-490-7B TaxID=2830843 RepID=UPI001C59D8DE|nr:hypothetical protein [Austwickia sp. TVS 96-490-7B]
MKGLIVDICVVVWRSVGGGVMLKLAAKIPPGVFWRCALALVHRQQARPVVVATPSQPALGVPMCRPVPCTSCAKTTWAGCGRHVDQVMATVPPQQRCTCPRPAGNTPGIMSRLLGR